MKTIKANDFPEVYKWLGINLNKLGCVMLDLEPIKPPTYIIQDEVDGAQVNYDVYLRDRLYVSPNKERFWIDGWVADKVPHITLLYGLLKEGKDYVPHIETVLRGWKLNEVEIEDIGFFESPYPDEEYWCIVAHIKKTDELLEGNARLQFLPHVNTFPTYSPHMTLCYIKKVPEEQRDHFIEDFRHEWKGKKLKVQDPINLGGNK